jgi:OOP family OmpA-OmpF porin
MIKSTVAILSIGLLASSGSFAESKLSGEFMLGLADQELKVFGEKASGDDTSFGLRLGYSFNTNFSAELSYQSYGEADDRYVDSSGDNIHDTIESDALMIGVKALIPLNNEFSLVGRLGISKWDAKVKHTDSSFPGQVFKGDDDGTDPYYGIGAEYRINESTFAGIEYTITEMEAEQNIDNEVTNIALSIGTRF